MTSFITTVLANPVFRLLREVILGSFPILRPLIQKFLGSFDLCVDVAGKAQKNLFAKVLRIMRYPVLPVTFVFFQRKIAVVVHLWFAKGLPEVVIGSENRSISFTRGLSIVFLESKVL